VSLFDNLAGHQAAVFKPDNVLIIHTRANLWIWTGRSSQYNVLVAAKKIAQQMVQFGECADLVAEVVSQGKEPSLLFRAFAD
jgi:hypothetical protein